MIDESSQPTGVDSFQLAIGCFRSERTERPNSEIFYGPVMKDHKTDSICVDDEVKPHAN